MSDTDPQDATSLRLRIPAVVSIVLTVGTLLVSVLGTFFTLSAKMDAAAAEIQALRRDMSGQYSTLTDRVRELDDRARAQERLIVELKTTLVVKGLLH